MVLRSMSWAADYLITTQYPGSSRQADRSPAGPAPPAHFRCSCAFLSGLRAHPGGRPPPPLDMRPQVVSGAPSWPGRPTLAWRTFAAWVRSPWGCPCSVTCPVRFSQAATRSHLVLYGVERRHTVSTPTRCVVFYTLARVESIDIGSFGPKPTTPNPASHNSIANDNRAWHQPFPEWWVDWMRKPLPVQIRKQ